MRRRSFLAATGGGMIAVALPQLGERALASDTLNYTLASSPLNFSPSSGLRFAGIGYNGSIPGPLLRAVRGQRFRATYHNRSGEPSTIHWHGVILPNAMDGVENVTQKAVPNGESFVYEFAPANAGTRWYHDHLSQGLQRGLFGMLIVDDPHETRADAEFALVFHDVPKPGSFMQAMMGESKAPMVDPIGSPEMTAMGMDMGMGDEVAYLAHCINGRSYPATTPLAVKVGQKVRLRILNANFTQTRYIRLGGHRLTVTHADGNSLAQTFTCDALRVGVGERYDAWFEVTKPGAWLLQGLSSDPLAYEQAVVVHTPGYQNATPVGSSQSLEGVEFFSYTGAGGTISGAPDLTGTTHYDLELNGGEMGSAKWTIDGKVYPNTPRIKVKRDELVSIRFTNKSDMDHPMHLHGHTFDVVEVDGKTLARPLAKDTSLVRSNNGTLTWRFKADSPGGRWLLHCHNDVHMMDGMATEVVYT